jgi:acyl carrier protein
VTPEALNGNNIMIGKPVSNTQLYILDESMNRMPIGIRGEIYVGAPHLARGYLNRPDLTAERFVPDLFGSLPGQRLLRTGDLGRLLDNGDIEFCGRADEQVKIRGFRVELAEVERTVLAHDTVSDAVIVAHEIGGQLRLVAYVTAKPEQAMVISDLKQFLNTRLPNYMMPSAFVVLRDLPLSNNGKIDRTALPNPNYKRADFSVPFEPPNSQIESTLVTIWNDLLGLPEIGINDSFLELGGDSLFAVQLLAKIADEFSVTLSLETIFNHPTIAEMAACIARACHSDK